jgi:amino acid adenylation domain-containing protein
MAIEAGVETVLPPTPIQEGMLFHTLLAPESGAYLEQWTARLCGPLDAAVYERCWQETVRRHPVLRTCFVWRKAPRTLQVVQRTAPLPVRHADWRGLSPGEQAQRLRDYLEDDRRSGFELTRAPLMRVALFALAEHEHRMVWTHHHALLDGWSVALVLDEVRRRYAAARRGEEVALSPAPPFQAYVEWLAGQDHWDAEHFWREHLRGFTAATPLPFRTGAAGTSRGYEEATLTLSRSASAGLRRGARRQRISLGSLVTAAWALLLSRAASEPDVVFGVTLASRPPELRGAESIVGPLINTLPARLQVDSGARCGDWLRSVQAGLAEAREFHGSPLVDIQRWSDVPLTLPLFESLVVVETYPDAASPGPPAADARELRVLEPAWHERTHYPLALTAVPGEQLGLRITAARDRCAAGAARRLLGQLRAALTALLADPERRLDDIELVNAAERRRLIAHGTGRARSRPDVTTDELISAQARRTPGALAVVSEAGTLDYRELDQRAAGLAARLAAMDVGPESVVAVCLPRSPSLLVAMLAVWKAGGAWLALDPGHPPARLAQLMADSGAAVVISDQACMRALPREHPPALGIDAEAGEPAATPRRKAVSDSLAYLMYTSGSTGAPKGVEITHRNLVNLLLAMGEEPGISARDTVLATTTVSFDIAALELFGPLAVGATVALAVRNAAIDGGYLSELITRLRPTIMQGTPATFRLLLEAGWRGDARLRVLLCGGETLPRPLAEDLLPLTAELWNVYGPTETTIWSTAHRVCTAAGRVPIGRPIANTTVQILDERDRLVPHGLPGELCIAGAGMARGYRGRPAQTAERFRPGPHDSGRLYHTGDRARWRLDGELEHLGRLDNQLKIHGVRIEPAEIEAVLTAHPAVAEAAVSAALGPNGLPQLIAYVTGPGTAGAATELRRWLADRLPTPFVPSHYLTLPALPRTPNNKLDRNALPPLPQAPAPASPGAQRQPTQTEAALCRIFAAVLGRERVMPADNFFDCGGHSLLAAQVVARVFAELGVELPLRTLFQHPTVAEIAGIANAAVPPRPVAGPDGAAADQGRFLDISERHPATAACNVPVALHLRGSLDVDRLRSALDSVANRHAALRTVFPAAAYRMPVVTAADGLPLRIGDIAPARRDAAVALEARRPFDPATGPLARAALLRVSGTEHVLVITAHHAIFDGWSIGVLLRELAAAFTDGAARAEPMTAVSSPPVQPAGERLAREAATTLPVGWGRARGEVSPSHRHVDRWPAALAADLGAVARHNNATLFMVLLASFLTLLHRRGGGPVLVTAVPVANRATPGSEDVIGLLASTVLVRTNLTGVRGPREALVRTRDSVLDAFTQRWSGTIARPMVVLQNTPVPALALPGLETGLLDVDLGATICDIVLSAHERRGDLTVILDCSADVLTPAAAEHLLHELRLTADELASRHQPIRARVKQDRPGL